LHLTQRCKKAKASTRAHSLQAEPTGFNKPFFQAESIKLKFVVVDEGKKSFRSLSNIFGTKSAGTFFASVLCEPNLPIEKVERAVITMPNTLSKLLKEICSVQDYRIIMAFAE
jgi:hypothetical protein